MRAGRRGFSLLEVLVVVAIIVMLAGLGSFYVFREYERSQEKAAHVRAKAIAGHLQSWEMDHPGQDLQSLEQLTQGADARMKPDEVLDPWGRPYQFAKEGDVWVVSTSRNNMVINNVSPPRR